MERSPNSAERLGRFIRLCLAVVSTPRTGAEARHTLVSTLWAANGLDRGQNEGFRGLWPCQHILASKGTVRPAGIKSALIGTYDNVVRNHTLQMAAALAYYFVLSLFPALILLSAAVAYLPVPDLFNQALALLARFLPADAMGLLRRVLADVVSPNRGAFLSLGVLGTLWAASGGFAATIEALNIAYDVRDDRPFWKTRPLAVGLAFLTGTLLLVALSVMIGGPKFGVWLASRVHCVFRWM